MIGEPPKKLHIRPKRYLWATFMTMLIAPWFTPAAVYMFFAAFTESEPAYVLAYALFGTLYIFPAFALPPLILFTILIAIKGQKILWAPSLIWGVQGFIVGCVFALFTVKFPVIPLSYLTASTAGGFIYRKFLLTPKQHKDVADFMRA